MIWSWPNLRVTCFLLVIAACGSVASEADAPVAADSGTQGDGPGSAADAHPGNNPPVVNSVTAALSPLPVTQQTTLTCAATDPDGDTLTYAWMVSSGTVTGTSDTVQFTAPDRAGPVTFGCTVTDAPGDSANAMDTLSVILPVDRLVAYYELDGNAADSGPAGLTGTVSGPVAAADRFGNSGRALSFDGVDDAVTLPQEGMFDLSSYTITAFIKVNAANTHRDIVSKGSATGFGTYTLRVVEDDSPGIPGRFSFGYDTAAGNFSCCGSGAALPTGTYVHVAITYDSAGVHYYQDGAMVGSGSATPPAASLNNDAARIGRGTFGAFSGSIDSVRFYSRPLSAGEISAIAADR